MKLLAVTDATLTRLAHRFRRSWRPLAVNDNLSPRSGGWAETMWDAAMIRQSFTGDD